MANKNCRSFKSTKMIFCFMVISGSLLVTYGRDLTLEPGHLKPFGEGRPSHAVEEIMGFPNPKNFFENYVKPLRPLKMVDGAKYSPAFKKWTDDYFLQQDEPADHYVSVETIKKESRKQNVLSMSFKDFVRTYNSTQNYMVDGVPFFMRSDVVMPCPLQCQPVMEKHLVDNVMWYSSGGTKSVVHTDSVDNINCLLRGTKTLIMVDPSVYKDKVDLDRPEGSYSDMDIDSIDYLKYPGMADVEYYHAHMVPGDCLYIPYKWIHQVRSFGSNLAVNVWWRHHMSEDLNYEDCNDPCDRSVTLQDAQFGGFSEAMMEPDEIRDHFLGILGKKPVFDLERFRTVLFGDQIEMLLEVPEIKADINLIFSSLDKDKDGLVSKQEIQDTTKNAYNSIGALMAKIEGDLQEINDELGNDEEEENTEDGTGKNDDLDERDEL